MAEVLVSSNINVKIPKKRGRKPKNKTNLSLSNTSEESTEPQEKVKKKRGRKPKNVIVDDSDKKEDNVITLRRRGRKPKDKFNYETTSFDDYQSNIKRNENVIIKLPVSCLKVENDLQLSNNFYKYNPNINVPKPFDNNEQEFLNLNRNNNYINHIKDQTNLIDNSKDIDQNDNQIDKDTILNTEHDNINKLQNEQINNTDLNSSGTIINKSTLPKIGILKDETIYMKKEELSKSNEQLRQIDVILNKKYKYNQEKIDIMSGFVSTSTIKVQKTDISCWWCCHNFECVPWGIPQKYVENNFELYGVFCSANCALAYLLDMDRDEDYLWEKVALLNLLHYKVYGKYENIIPSPNKIALQKFGGSMTLEEFHNLIELNNKSYTVEFPPCNNVIPILEEIYKKNNLISSFIPVDKNRISKANNELKLKRSTPINNNRNTLDSCMNIKF
jgi:hypothetical protein